MRERTQERYLKISEEDSVTDKSSSSTNRLELRSEKAKTLRGSGGYYKGDVINCDYSVRDHRGRKRGVVVSLAEVGDTTVAVQVRAKIPVLPDAIFRLRMPPVVPVAAPQVVMAGQ